MRANRQHGLKNWKRAEKHEVTLKTARDPRTKFMLNHIGENIVILHKGKKRKVRPVTVLTVPSFRKSYLVAKVGLFRKKHFDIDGIEKWKLSGFLTKWE